MRARRSGSLARRGAPSAGDLDEGVPGGLRAEAGAGVEEAGRVAEAAEARQVLPGEPVNLAQVEPPAIGDQVAVGGAQLARLAAAADLEGDHRGIVLRAPA